MFVFKNKIVNSGPITDPFIVDVRVGVCSIVSQISNTSMQFHQVLILQVCIKLRCRSVYEMLE